MKIIKQIDDKTRLVQVGKIPSVKIALQRKRWWGWNTINRIGSSRYDTIEEFEKILLYDERLRKNPSGKVNAEKF